MNESLKRPLLTVIIPVYKAEKTLYRCVRSVATQDVRGGLQIVLVDDGSPDRCGELCEQWALEDPRIVVAHRPNGGLSAARNTGLRLAQGEYITFVDADDCVCEHTYRDVMAKMKPEYDFLEYPLARINSERKVYDITALADYTFDEPIFYWYVTQAYRHTYACNKIFHRSVFRELRFAEGKLYEDAWLMSALLPRCKCVATVSVGAYFYYDNPEGITHKQGRLALANLLVAHMSGCFCLPNTPYYMYLLNLQIDVYRQTGRILMDHQRVKTGELKDRKERVKGWLNNLLGLRITCILFTLHHKLSHRRQSPS